MKTNEINRQKGMKLISKILFLLFGLNYFISLSLIAGNFTLNYHPNDNKDSTFAHQQYQKSIQLFANSNYDSAIVAAEQGITATNRANLPYLRARLSTLVAQAYHKKGIDSYALRYYQAVINIYDKFKDSLNLSEAYTDIAFIYFKLGIKEKAADNLILALIILPKTGYPEKNALINELLGLANTDLGEFDKGIQCFDVALDYWKKENNQNKVININYQIAEIYKKSKNYRKLLETNLLINELLRNTGDFNNLTNSYNNIGYSYNHLQEYKEAHKAFLQALFMDEQHGNNLMNKALTYINLGICCQNMGDYEDALKNLNEAKKIYEQKDAYCEIARVYNIIALVYIQKKDYYNASIYSTKGIELARNYKCTEALQVCYLTSSNIAQFSDDYENALQYYKNYLGIRDSLLLEQRFKEQNLYSQQYILEKSEKEMQLLLADQEMKDLALKQLRLEAEKNEKELELIKRNNILQELEKEKALQLLAITRQQHETEVKNNQIKLLQHDKELQDAQLKQSEFEKKEKLKEIELLERQKELQRLQIEKNEESKKHFMRLVALFALVFILILISFIITKRKNKVLAQQKKEIQLKNYELEQKNEEINVQKENLIKANVEINEKNVDLEQKNEEITSQKESLEMANIEIQKKNLDLEQKNQEIIAQRDQIIEQKEIIEIRNLAITDSIYYARRIQKAILKPAEDAATLLKEYFVFFRPRDIVSGDFYWIKEVNGHIIIAAVDCTGHGVPGALMSMLGAAFLNEIVHRKDINKASLVLDELKTMVIQFLQQTGKDTEAKDGMDIALCVIHPDRKKMEYAGAFNPLYMFKNGNLIEYKADRMPISLSRKGNKLFTNHEIEIEEGDVCYIFTDGFYDQFGEQTQYCMTPKRLKSMLSEIHHKHLPQQKIILEQFFNDWKGNQDQLDDVLLLGFRI